MKHLESAAISVLEQSVSKIVTWTASEGIPLVKYSHRWKKPRAVTNQ